MVLVLVLWLLLFVYGVSALQEQHEQHTLYTTIRQELALATVPLGGVVKPGTPLAVMSSAQLGLRNAVIVEGTSSGDLTAGPGHLRSTPLPGQAGVSVIMGKGTSYGAPFGDLGALHPGDRITFVTGQGTFTYTVSDVRRPGDSLPAPLASGASRVVLASESGGLRPDSVVYVDADLTKGSVQPSPGGQPAAVPANEQPMASDTGHLVPLVLWLQLDLLVAAGLVWAAVSWRPEPLWLVGAPAVVALLWATTATAAPLLPNLF